MSPILDPNILEFFSRSPEQTRRVGMRLGTLLRRGSVLCLSGDLGSGKTTMVQGIARGWGSPDNVTSPTFILVNQYRRPDGNRMYHLDAYRLAGAMEAEDLDLDLMLEEGCLVIEWPEKIQDVLPGNTLWVNLAWLSEETRHMVFQPAGKVYKDMVEDLRQQAFGG